MSYTFEFLLDDLRKRDTSILFGKTLDSKERALDFKDYANRNGFSVHVITDDRNNWIIQSDKSYQWLNKSWLSKRFKSYNRDKKQDGVLKF